MQKAAEGATSRRRRTQKFNQLKTVTQKLEAFRAQHAAVLEELGELAKEYNAALSDVEKHLRANPEKIHIGAFKSYFKRSTPQIDFTQIILNAPGILTEPGVVTRIDVDQAQIAAERLKCEDELKAAVTETETMALSKPKALQLEWTRE